MKSSRLTNKIEDLRVVIQVFVAIMLALEVFYVGVLFVSVSDITTMVYTNREEALKDTDLRKLQSYKQNGNTWELEILNEEDDTTTKETRKDLTLAYSLRIDKYKSGAIYYSEQGKAIVEVVDGKFFIDYIGFGSSLLGLLGLVTLLAILVWCNKQKTLGWVQDKKVLILTCIIGVLHIGDLVGGYIMFSL